MKSLYDLQLLGFEENKLADDLAEFALDNF